jgi:hypothetical protein
MLASLLERLNLTFAMFAAYYNRCWQFQMPGKSGQKRSTAAMISQANW